METVMTDNNEHRRTSKPCMFCGELTEGGIFGIAPICSKEDTCLVDAVNRSEWLFRQCKEKINKDREAAEAAGATVEAIGEAFIESLDLNDKVLFFREMMEKANIHGLARDIMVSKFIEANYAHL